MAAAAGLLALSMLFLRKPTHPSQRGVEEGGSADPYPYQARQLHYPECPISALYLPSARPVCGPAHALILYSMDKLIRPVYGIRRGSWITLAG